MRLLLLTLLFIAAVTSGNAFVVTSSSRSAFRLALHPDQASDLEAHANMLLKTSSLGKGNEANLVPPPKNRAAVHRERESGGPMAWCRRLLQKNKGKVQQKQTDSTQAH
jgi:hypothetical protein